MTTNWIHNKHIPLWCILLLTILVFSPTFGNGFQMEWDDQWMVVNSQTVGRPSLYWLQKIFKVPSHGQIAPVNQALYTLLYRSFGFNPLAYHTACLILHLINISLLHIGLNTLLRDCTKFSSTRAKWIVNITTLLFAIHPLQVECVAWISASKIPLSTTFYFAGAIMLMKYLRNNNPWWYVGTLLTQLMAYLSKEQAVIFPLFATLLFIWYGIRPPKRKFWFGLIPFGALGLVYAIHEIFFIANYDQYIQGDTYVWWQRMIFCIYSIITYFFKWLVPINLNWMYLFPIGMEESMPLWLILYPVLATFLVFALWDWLKKPLVLSLLAFFIIHLLLVLHITVLPRASVIADRYLYISIISLNFGLAYLMTEIRGFEKRRKLLYSILSVIVVALGVISFSRTMDWKDSDTLRSVYNGESSSIVK